MLTYKNPIVFERADPWVYKHTDGYYYFTGSVPGYRTIELRRAKTIAGLRASKPKDIWFAHQEGPMSELIWAPEIHHLNGKWYIYFAASDNEEIRNDKHFHRMFVIENSHENPLLGEWVEKGQIKTHQASFSLDGTVFLYQEQLYYVWAQLEPTVPGNSNLYLAKMKNPWTLEGKELLLSIPEHDWEKIGFMVNEAPAVIIRNGKVIITYSASATDENYAMGLLWADADGDLLDGYSWHKLENPVFTSSERNQQYGPGHNSFTIAEDGKTDLIVYHARPQKNDSGDPLQNPNRHARIQSFTWLEDGLPFFGEPVKD